MALAVKDESFDFTFFSDLAGIKAIEYREAGKQLIDDLKEG